MKTYKQIDFWGSVALIAGFTVVSLIRLDFTFLIGYFIVGIWQISSILIHKYNRWFTKKDSSRIRYSNAAFIVIAAIILSLLCLSKNGDGIAGIISAIVLFLILLATPFMAIIYTIICYNELFVAIPRRESAHLR